MFSGSLHNRKVSHRSMSQPDCPVPLTQGAYPTFAINATDDEKKLAISEFISDEHGIKVVDAVQELLKNQFI